MDGELLARALRVCPDETRVVKVNAEVLLKDVLDYRGQEGRYSPRASILGEVARPRGVLVNVDV
jgi:hypothetical protein